MKEKELWGVDLISTIEKCKEFYGGTCGISCPHKVKGSCRQYLMGQILKYIKLQKEIEATQDELIKNQYDDRHRLMRENEELKAKRKKILAYKVLSEETLKGETKADLIERIRILEHNWACAEENFNNSVKNSEKIFAEQKAEIERLKENLFSANFCATVFSDKLKGKTKIIEELQKQVDERENEIDRLEKVVADQAEQYYDCEQRTAKEILQWLIEHTFESCIFETYFRERFGVEVDK